MLPSARGLRRFQNFINPRHHFAGVVEQAGADEGVVEDLLGDEGGFFRGGGACRGEVFYHGVAGVYFQIHF